jgi:uncharacterized membrane protein YfcA
MLFFFIGAVMQGFLGFAFALVAMGGLSLVTDLRHAAAVVNVAALAQYAWMVIALRRHVHWTVVWRMLPAISVGIVLGIYALKVGDPGLLKTLLGVTVTALAAWYLWGPAPSSDPPAWQDSPVGLVSGIFTGLFNTGGPPLVAHIYRRPDPPDRLKGTVQTLFIIGSTVRLGAAVSQGMITRSVLIDAGIGLFAGISGVICGMALGRRTSPERFRKLSWIGLIVLGLIITFSP